MSKRQQRTIGAIVKIELGNEYHSYARILDKSNFAFYDYRTRDEIEDLKFVVEHPILFIIAVYNDVITKGRWQKIGILPLEESLKRLPFKFIQDPHNSEKFELYNSNTGEITQSTRNETEGLECAAVWEAKHVEDRLRDHFEGRKNIWVEQLKAK